MSNMTADWLVVGAGIMGLTIARELNKRFPKDSIALLEKESAVGKHASGRNSGVLHAGMYYTPGSLKARFCVDGSRAMLAYCVEKDLPVLRCGKVIVAQNPEQEQHVVTLFANARANGSNQVEIIGPEQLRSIEPHAIAARKALYSPITAVIDPKAVVQQLAADLSATGQTKLLLGEELVKVDIKAGVASTSKNTINFGRLVNAAGAFADKVGHMCDVGREFSILPFRGAYYKLSADSPVKVNGNIYPVPDLRVPFLGIHFTRSVSGDVYLGPSAMPALGRENYTLGEKIEWASLPQTLTQLARAYLTNRQGLRVLMHKEIQQLFKRHFFHTAQKLAPSLRITDLKPATKVGIRAQLVNTQTGELVMDFCVRNGERATHILNSVSPAFTCSLKFAEYVVDEYVMKPKSV